MLFFLVSCLSYLMLSQSFLKPHPAPKMETLPWILFFYLLNQKTKFFIRILQAPKFFPSNKEVSNPRFELPDEIEDEKQGNQLSLLDLPDLAIDVILEKLSPAELCSMARVCNSLKEKCTSDYLWQKPMKQKWGELIGEAAFREWQFQIAPRGAPRFPHFTARRSKFGLFSGLLGLFGLKSKTMEEKRSSLSANSVMSCYLALERGKFWFPAQVFNREVQNGQVGFMLSCYDAQLSYGSTTDNFVARYKAQGRCMIEEGIEWKRIRAASVDTPANALHISHCLHELKPDDHIEIQWRKRKDFPFGWWYGVVGHLDSCSGNEFSCRCHVNDTVVLEFKQYAPGSRWRRMEISRKDHREVGNEADGFYGGIRKLSKQDEIEKWKQLWPNCTLE